LTLADRRPAVLERLGAVIEASYGPVRHAVGGEPAEHGRRRFRVEIADRWEVGQASFLGYNPLQTLSPADAARLAGHAFFPSLIAEPFHHGLVLVLSFSIVASVVAALASAMRGGQYVHMENESVSLQEASQV